MLGVLCSISLKPAWQMAISTAHGCAQMLEKALIKNVTWLLSHVKTLALFFAFKVGSTPTLMVCRSLSL